MDYTGKEFNDPILRCEGCTKLVHRVWISEKGGCNHCGNKRFKALHGMNEEELNQLKTGEYDFGLKSYEIDLDFLKLFEPEEAI